MIEVWKVNYIAMKRKDDLAPRERYEESRVDELSTFKSNYVVIGPLRTNMHQLTGWFCPMNATNKCSVQGVFFISRICMVEKRLYPRVG